MARILLIENHSSLGRLIGLYLLDAGYEVSKVETPEEAEGRLADPSHPDVIVFNTGLPPEQKSAFIYGWRQRAPGTKILEISEDPLIVAPGASTLERVGAADAYLTTPFDFARISEVITECLGQET